MKKIIFCHLLLVISLITEAQPVIKYVTVDYLTTPDQINLLKERFDSKVGLKIININKLLVDINKDIQKTSFNETVPSLFENFSKGLAPAAASTATAFSPGEELLFTGNGITDAALPTAITDRLIKLHQEYKKTGEELLEIEQRIASYGEIYTSIRSLLQYQQNLINLQKTCNTSFSVIETQLVAETKNTLLALLPQNHPDRALLQMGSNIIQDKMILGRFIGATLHTAQTTFNQITQNFLPGNIDRLTKKIEAINKEIASLETALKAIPARSRNAAINALQTTLTEKRLENGLGNGLADLEAKYKLHDIPTLQKDIDSFGAKGKVELFAVYDWFNEGNYTYYISPETIDKDLVVITATIVPKENVPCAPLAKSYELKVRPKGGLKIDFSTGLFLNFGGNNFKDQTYRYDTVAGEPDNRIIVQNKTKNSIFPSVGALMHIYTRNANDFHFSGTFGISTKDLEKINYHLGGSAIFGYSHRFILSGGLTLTKATLISDSYEVGQKVVKAGSPDDIPTSNFTRLGFFIAFTYNLTAK